MYDPYEPIVPDEVYPDRSDRCPSCETRWDGVECATCGMTAEDQADREARGLGREYVRSAT